MSNSSATDLATRAHAFLFSEGGSLGKKKLASLLLCSSSELADALAILAKRLETTGEVLIETATDVTLAVSASVSGIVRDAFEKELGEEIGAAGLEVLAIVLYRGPSTRAQIDYIRGVNTSSTLRNLLARGLLERVGNPDDAREYLYRPTVQLLSHLGVTNIEKLPDYQAITAELSAFEKEREPFVESGDSTDKRDTGTIEA